MHTLDTKLTDFKNRIHGWTPNNGFKPSKIDYSPQDIIFGRRVSTAVQKHGCCADPDGVVADVRNEATQNARFRTWFLEVPLERLQSLCEFLIYETPPV